MGVIKGALKIRNIIALLVHQGETKHIIRKLFAQPIDYPAAFSSCVHKIRVFGFSSPFLVFLLAQTYHHYGLDFQKKKLQEQEYLLRILTGFLQRGNTYCYVLKKSA